MQLYLGSRLAQELGLEIRRRVTLSVAGCNIKTWISIREEQKRSFSVAKASREALAVLNTPHPLALHYDQGTSTIKVGPVVGVLTGQPAMTLKGKTVSLYKTISETARRSGIVCYFFSPHFVDLEKEIINGFMYHRGREGRWTLQEMPFPDIVYLQTGALSENLVPEYQLFVEICQEKHKLIEWINPYSLSIDDKLINHNSLLDCSSMQCYLPETKACKETGDIFALLEHWNAVYLKPVFASRGLGIYKISICNDGEHRYLLEYGNSPGQDKKVFRDKTRLASELSSIIYSKPYLVQQGLNLVHYDEGRPVDFRVHLFKNERGKWDVIYIQAKVGPLGGIVTGRLWGGRVQPAEEVLAHIFSPGESEQIAGEIARASIMCVETLERQTGVCYGELGLDLGVDVNKKVWFIEINSKPNWMVSRDTVKEAREKKSLAGHLFGYSRYLLGLERCRSAIGFFVQNYN